MNTRTTVINSKKQVSTSKARKQSVLNKNTNEIKDGLDNNEANKEYDR